MELLREDCIVESFGTGTAWFPSYNGVCVTHVPTGIIERCGENRSVHANLEKAMAGIQKKIEHIDRREEVMNGRISVGLPSSRQLAHCLAASAIHQIGGSLEEEAKKPGSTILIDLTQKMRKCAEHILEAIQDDPWMFHVLVSTAISSGVLKLIDTMENHDG